MTHPTPGDSAHRPASPYAAGGPAKFGTPDISTAWTASYIAPANVYGPRQGPTVKRVWWGDSRRRCSGKPPGCSATAINTRDYGLSTVDAFVRVRDRRWAASTSASTGGQNVGRQLHSAVVVAVGGPTTLSSTSPRLAILSGFGPA